MSSPALTLGFESSHFFAYCGGGGGVQQGPLGTSAIYWPIVPAPDDYDGEFGGMKIGRGNRSTRRKPAPAPLCPPLEALIYVCFSAYFPYSRK
jgi:hypothetical protein